MWKPDGKIVLLGDMNVGKTSLLQRYMERRFADTVSTVGGAFYLKQWRSYNISIWDTAGEGWRLPGPRRPGSRQGRGRGASRPRVASAGPGPDKAGVLRGGRPRAGLPGYTQGPFLSLQVTPLQGSGPQTQCMPTLDSSLPTCSPLLVGKLLLFNHLVHLVTIQLMLKKYP